MTSEDDRAGRRRLLKGAIGLGIGRALRIGQDDPAAIRPKPGDLLVKVDDSTRRPLTADDIPRRAKPTMAWAMDAIDGTVRSGSRLNRVLLLRFESDELTGETAARAADGVVAYTAICTHTGCEVTEWLLEEQHLHCPCHDSKFDPKDGARVVDGPAPRPLPALPLTTADGKLAVAKAFTSRVGFERE
jgi:Rieske Fe-S protein